MKAKDQKSLSFICPICDRKFGSNRSLASHKAWHTSGPRPNPNDLMTPEAVIERARKGGIAAAGSPKQVIHLKKLHKKFEKTDHYRKMGRLGLESEIRSDPEWIEKTYRKVSQTHRISKKAAEQRQRVDLARKGAEGKMRKWKKYIYNGFGFRSTYEVRFAYVLDLIQIDWEYEPRWFDYKDLNGVDRRYKPDFYLTDLDIYVEVTGCFLEDKKVKLIDTCQRNKIFILVVNGDTLNDMGLSNDQIEFTKDEKAKLVYANTEPSQIRNNLEGVETTIENLRKQFVSMVSRLHERLPIREDRRYSPSLQEIVRTEDKELQDNTNVAYAPYIPLFATPTLVTADLYAQKGFLSSAGFKVINPALFTLGTISGTYFGG